MMCHVRLFVVMEEFQQYRKGNQITNQQFKASLKKVLESETIKKEGRNLSANEKIKIDQISNKLVKVFDTNKNGKLEYQEAISAFCTFCKGSVQAKIKYQMLAYSEVYTKQNTSQVQSIKNEDVGIRLKNLKKFIGAVLKLALCSGSEIMLDYDIDKLASATAEKCFDNQGVARDGIVSLNAVTEFIETASLPPIFSPMEGNDPSK